MTKTLLLIIPFILVACTQKPAKIVYKGAGKTEKYTVSHKTARKDRPVSKISTPSKKGNLTIQKGDNVSVLAKKYNVSRRDIIEANNLKAPYILKIGQKIHLPRSSYKVQEGDNLHKIATKLGVSQKNLISMNNLKNPYRIFPGQKLKIPSENYKPAKIVKTAKASPKKKAPKKIVAKKTSNKFIWPINGRVITKFGPGEGGTYHDGINIAAEDGQEIKAAASGTVVYVGNKLKGYGNLVIIKHGGRWITAYAHNKQIKVKKGDNVEQGQIIALAGATGNVTTPQLHFGLRDGRKAVNPEKYLK